MQEDIENRAVNLAINTTKLTARTIIQAGAYINRQYINRQMEMMDEVPAGKQSIKDLIGQNEGVSSVPIEKTGIRDFEKVARKYGIDFAITKDKTQKPPRYTVFFKARDAEALNAAIDEYGAKHLKKQSRPSVLKALKKLKDRAVNTPDKTRQKSQERDL